MRNKRERNPSKNFMANLEPAANGSAELARDYAEAASAAQVAEAQSSQSQYLWYALPVVVIAAVLIAVKRSKKPSDQ